MTRSLSASSLSMILMLKEPRAKAVMRAINDHRSAVEKGLLLKLPFTTIFEYLQILQMIVLSMNKLGQCGMFYLAAAVSDFSVPWKTMLEHKIQSGSGPLDMRLVKCQRCLLF